MTRINPRVLAWRPHTSQGSLRGFAHIEIELEDGLISFEDVRLIRAEDKPPFVCPPQSSWKNAQDEWQNKKLVHWPAVWNVAILNAVLDAERDYPNGLIVSPRLPYRGDSPSTTRNTPNRYGSHTSRSNSGGRQ